ncbi:MAG TPA: hypothetical protein VLT33_04465 [Labilithrix sp.]|nr:hypothetical protein [Labilithrix sp.]
MADVILEILDALLTTTPAEKALREARALGDSQSAQDERIGALEAQVASLQRTVATLTAVLVRTGVVSDADGRGVVRAARRPHESFESDSADETEEDRTGGAILGSAYRGGVPTDGQGCSVCGKRLGADDPVLTLASRGNVCTMCFTRGG